MNTTETQKYHSKKQKRLLVWTIVAVILLTVAWNIGIISQLFGFNAYWVQDNFTFLSVMSISLVIVCVTSISTIINWRKLPDRNISIVIVIISLWMIIVILRTGIAILKWR
jgi:hypothetical protein